MANNELVPNSSTGYLITMTNFLSLVRADYWKSQARKYCDFCKCWISDNKPSVQFHENGKRHKSSVEARLKEISKKSSADQKSKLQMESDIKKMEEAAMKAYMRDLEQNPDLSSHTIETSDEHKITRPKGPVEEKKTSWHEAKSPEGHVYYWHSVSGESKWEVPAEGFISMKDQTVKTTATCKREASKSVKKTFSKNSIDKTSGKPKFEKSKKKVKLESVATTAAKKLAPTDFESPSTSKPYGTWEPVISDNRIPEPTDLQLPTSTHVLLRLSQPLADVERGVDIEFTEKSASNANGCHDDAVSSHGDFKFKKPKMNRNNTRQRNADL